MSYQAHDTHLFQKTAAWAMIETMSEEPAQAVSTKYALGDETQWLRWGALLYSIFWFAEPIQRRSILVWTVFLLFYGIFLTGYLRVLRGTQTEQRIWLVVLFLLGYIYYPFNPNAGGEFVFAVVVSNFFLKQGDAQVAFRSFLAILAAQTAGLYLETWLLHLPWGIAKSVIFFMVVLGLGNFTFARQVLISRQLRQANEEIERLTQQAERERIARDLHDLLGHTLTVIAVKSDIANRLFRVKPELAHREIADVETTAREALRQVRSVVAGYRMDGISEEVTKVRDVLSSSGVELVAEIGTIALPDEDKDILCFVMREAVTNVLRHATATKCHIQLTGGDTVKLMIEDNGCGKRGSDGNGIRGMRERLAHANGHLELDSSPKGGVRVLAELPNRCQNGSAVASATMKGRIR